MVVVSWRGGESQQRQQECDDEVVTDTGDDSSAVTAPPPKRQHQHERRTHTSPTRACVGLLPLELGICLLCPSMVFGWARGRVLGVNLQGENIYPLQIPTNCSVFTSGPNKCSIFHT